MAARETRYPRYSILSEKFGIGRSIERLGVPSPSRHIDIAGEIRVCHYRFAQCPALLLLVDKSADEIAQHVSRDDSSLRRIDECKKSQMR
jgi:hypothetical protein